MSKIKFLLTSLLVLFITNVFALEKSFYILRGTAPTENMQKHVRQINILIAQAYHIDAAGNVTGFVNPTTLAFANKHKIKLMALVTNNAFDTEVAHQFLSDSSAQQRAMDFLLEQCKNQHLYGLQFDFEGVDANDRTALTRFFTDAYQALHQQGYKVSYAVIPEVAHHAKSAYNDRRYQHWTGAYDLKALASVADFITIMTYDQHQDGTTPGPFAGIKWMAAAIKYALQYVPRGKLFLGVPTYSGYWYLGSSGNGKRVSVHTDDIDYKRVQEILRDNHIKLRWDEENKINYAIFQRDWLNEFIFVENARSFRAKLNLAKRHHLRGVSIFAIGNEDPAIWAL